MPATAGALEGHFGQKEEKKRTRLARRVKAAARSGKADTVPRDEEEITREESGSELELAEIRADFSRFAPLLSLFVPSSRLTRQDLLSASFIGIAIRDRAGTEERNEGGWKRGSERSDVKKPRGVALVFPSTSSSASPGDRQDRPDGDASSAPGPFAHPKELAPSRLAPRDKDEARRGRREGAGGVRSGEIGALAAEEGRPGLDDKSSHRAVISEERKSTTARPSDNGHFNRKR
ncbi:hypothetical protein KM043_012294 [Ampulex compressa]|nr:hypothetical protein KM043_012294 [Ampulex compressa]